MLLAILTTLAFLVVLFPLILLGVITPQTAALLLIGTLVLRVIARELMSYIMPVMAILIFIWLMAGTDSQGFTYFFAQFLLLGFMFFGFAIIIKGFSRK